MIELEDVHRYYGAQRAVSGLSFRIGRGECVGLLGLNGAGKSTTLRMLAGLSLPTRGSVRVGGEPLTASSHALRARIGYLPDRPPVYEDMTVARYLVFAARLRGVPRELAASAVDKVLDTCGLSRSAEQSIATLSHGFRQRVGIAQAIVHAPPVVVLDEPSQGLDPAQNLDMRALMRSLAKVHTVVLSTHLLADISQCCDRILLIHEGRLIAQGSESELLSGLPTVSSQRLSLRARGMTPEVRLALENVPGVLSVRVRGSHEPRELEIEAERDVRAEVSRALVRGGVDLLELSSNTRGLEALFSDLGRAQNDKRGE